MDINAYRPENLVVLPARDASDALLLSAQFATAADHWLAEQKKNKPKPAPTLPESIAAALHDVAQKRAELEVVQAPLPPTPPAVKIADAAEDNAVGAFAAWNKAFLRLPLGDP